MSNITPLDALVALGEVEVVSNGVPTNADEFATMMYKADGTSISSTWDQVVAKMSELEATHTNNQYQRDRASAYPSIADQLDQIYHEGIDAWKETIAAVKAEYPKP